MNRLIIIGNGFDLAHGMKTSYKDFILWYFQKKYDELKNEFLQPKADSLTSFTRGYNQILNFEFKSTEDILWFKYFSDDSERLVHRRKLLTTKKLNPSLKNENNNEAFEFSFLSTFFEKLVTTFFDTNWVDIEQEYYKELICILNSANEGNKLPSLKTLNSEFLTLIESFTEFIIKQKSKQNNSSFQTYLESKIDLNEHILLNELEKNTIMNKIQKHDDGDYKLQLLKPLETIVLNFNYTDTVEHYLSHEQLKGKYSINYIHKKNEYDIIFGFGDEMDDDYKRIELKNENEYLRFIKSFGYFENSNYRDLIRFIDSDLFEVFIWGHSCGLSDRTLLNMIFEHENCKLIKIFYHKDEEKGLDNYTQLTQEISRHFKEKGLMRKKILDKVHSTPLPQAK